jgi:opacity protein-like surface antigen
MSSLLRRSAAILLLAAFVAACGGAAAARPAVDSGDDAAQSGGNAPALDQGANADVTGPDGSAQPEDAGVDAIGASNITIGGAIETEIRGIGFCAPNNIEPADRDFGFDNLGDDFDYEADTMWMLSIDIEDYAGAGEYETTDDAPGKASIHLSDGAGTAYDAGPDAGTFTVEDGDEWGSIDVTLTNSETGETVTVQGTFVCAA